MSEQNNFDGSCRYHSNPRSKANGNTTNRYWVAVLQDNLEKKQ